MTAADRSEAEDALVQAHLREVAPLPAYSTEEWDRLSRRVELAAEAVFTARAARPSWRDDLVSLARIALPVALAAGIAALVLLDRVETRATNEAAPVSAFLSAMAGETTRETVLDMTLGQTGQGLLLADGR
jgi:hypothetical protein